MSNTIAQMLVFQCVLRFFRHASCPKEKLASLSVQKIETEDIRSFPCQVLGLLEDCGAFSEDDMSGIAVWEPKSIGWLLTPDSGGGRASCDG